MTEQIKLGRGIMTVGGNEYSFAEATITQSDDKATLEEMERIINRPEARRKDAMYREIDYP